MQTPPTITSLTLLLADSLHKVRKREAGEIAVDEIESASFLVYRAMTNRSRHYHDLTHLFHVARDLPALAKLAAIYHDVVYFSVDGGFPTDVGERLADVMVCHDDRIYLTTSADEMVSDVATIFGFTAGQQLKQEGGLSEFLSAVLAVRELRNFLSDQNLWAVAACIEATIPFRPAVDGVTPTDLLGMRLGCLRRGTLSLTEEEIHDIKILAVRIANADVQSFGKPELSHFIENTWQILTETNADFHQAGAYSILTYRESLVRMKMFLSHLDPTVIFRQYGNTPDHDSYQTLIECSKDHLRDSLEYVKAHIVATSVVEALAERSGGDGPLSYFIGAADAGIFQNLAAVDRAPNVKNSNQPSWNDQVMAELKSKLAGVPRFDHALLPLAAYFYELLGSGGIAELAGHACEVYEKKQNWKWFIELLPREAISEVATAMARSAVLRKDRFNEWINP